MKALFMLGRAKNDSTYVPYLGEILLREETDGRIQTLVGDGKTAAKDLLPLVTYDLHTRVSKLEEEVKNLRSLIQKDKEK